MPVPTFEERHAPFAVANSYTVTNEEPELFRRMLGRKRFGRVAGICSGGEIPLFVLLPRAEEVVAIDHDYNALSITFQKAAMLDLLGAATLTKLLINQDWIELQKALDTAHEMLPPALKERLNTAKVSYNGGRLSSTHLITFRREWGISGVLRQLGRVQPKVGRLHLIHGDLTDLVGESFDALYISNAMEHSNRLKRSLKLTDFEAIVKPGGFLLGTHTTSHFGDSPNPMWSEVSEVLGFRSGWRHHILRRVGAPDAVTAQPATA